MDDDASAASSSRRMFPSFSRGRGRDRPGAGGTGTISESSITMSYDGGSGGRRTSMPAVSGGKQGGRDAGESSAADRNQRSASTPDVGSVGGGSRRRARSRPRDRDGPPKGGGGGEANGAPGRPSRHRSKSRTRDRDRDRARSKSAGRSKSSRYATDSTPSSEIVREESLRDYWKRRAEESKEKVGETPAASSGGWREKLAEYDPPDQDGGGSGRPPPPPRSSAKSSGSVGGTSRQRSRRSSRAADGLSGGGGSSRGGGGVDSIASAISSHRSPVRPADAKSSSASNPSRTASARPQAPAGPSSDLTSSLAGEPEDLSSLSPLHRALATSSWDDLHSLVSDLRSQPAGEVAAQLSMPHPREGGTVLHVAAWRAPPALAVAMIRLMSRTSREMTILQSIRDGEGNTPLHLCCGNLDYRGDDGDGKGEDGDESGEDFDPLAALREICGTVPPKAWTVQNSEGDTPLHLLVASSLCTNLGASSSSSGTADDARRGALSREAVRLALSTPEGREAAMSRERTGGTPLHAAMAAGARDSVVSSLIEGCPAAARTEDSRGMLPLHWAAAFGRASHAAVRKLAGECPQALTHATVDGDIPLHLAVSNAVMVDDGGGGGTRRGTADGAGGGDGTPGRVDKNRLKIVEVLMHDHGRSRSSSQSSRNTNDAGAEPTSPILATNREKLTPLHCCALFDAPPQISKLLMRHPDANAASSMTNSFGATPLHLAAAQPGVSQSIATVLAIGSPDAASVQDRLKRTPLHVAAQNTYATNLLIKTLAELNPGAAGVKTQRGHLPLHLAAQSQAKEAVIRALIKAHPGAAEARNKSNNTPLHDAAKYRASLGAVRLLLDAYPGALYVQNQYGNLPLHCATAYQAPADVVQLLLKSWPEGASMQNRNQDAPLHYAAAYATSAAAVRPLIEAAPAAVLLLNSSGQSPADRARANSAPGEITELLERAAEEYTRQAGRDGSWASFGGGGRGDAEF